MSRNLESIAAAHLAANDRRKAGKPIWDYRVRIKHLLDTDDYSDENAQRIGKQAADVLRASRWFRDQGDGLLTDLVDELADVDDLDHFNTVLDAIYDVADADRAWIG